MYIEIMYADKDENGKFIRWRAPIEKAGESRRDGVLFIILSEIDPETGKYRRIAEEWERPSIACHNIYGGDNYGLLVKPNHVMLFGWSDEQFVWIDKNHLWSGAHRSKHGKIPGLLSDTILWRGEALSEEDWQEALNQFKDMN